MNQNESRRGIMSKALTCFVLATTALRPAPALADSLNGYGVISELKGPGQPNLTSIMEKYPNPNKGEYMEIRDLYDQINVAETYEEQDKLWTEIITTYKDYPLVVSKAYVNRGNMKFVNGKTDAAFADY